MARITLLLRHFLSREVHSPSILLGTSRTLGLGGLHPLLMDTVSKGDVDGILFSLYPEVQTSYNSF